MALVQCPNCGRKISDKTYKCPGCGYELKESEKSNLVNGESDTINKNTKDMGNNCSIMYYTWTYCSVYICG